MIEANVEHSGLPVEAVEHLDGAVGVDIIGEEDGAEALRAVLSCEGYIGAQDGAAATKEVFEILPPHAKGELLQESMVRILKQAKVGIVMKPTFPTKS